MNANFVASVFLIVSTFHVAIGCPHCFEVSARRRRSNVHNQILAEVDMTMKLAKQTEPTSVSSIEKCINAEKAIGKILDMQSHSHLREKAKNFLVTINEWYHGPIPIRQPQPYYSLLEEEFPGVSMIQSLTEAEFGKCFQIFNDLHATYEQYRNEQTQSDYAAKYAERFSSDSMTAEENGMNVMDESLQAQEDRETYQYYN